MAMQQSLSKLNMKFFGPKNQKWGPLKDHKRATKKVRHPQVQQHLLFHIFQPPILQIRHLLKSKGIAVGSEVGPISTQASRQKSGFNCGSIMPFVRKLNHDDLGHLIHFITGQHHLLKHRRKLEQGGMTCAGCVG